MVGLGWREHVWDLCVLSNDNNVGNVCCQERRMGSQWALAKWMRLLLHPKWGCDCERGKKIVEEIILNWELLGFPRFFRFLGILNINQNHRFII